MTNNPDILLATWLMAAQDRDPAIRRQAIEQIAAHGNSPTGRSGVPALIAALQSDDDDTHTAALSALMEVAPDSDEALDAIVQMSHAGRPLHCWGLAELAKRAGPKAVRLAPLLCEMLAEANRTAPGFYHEPIIQAFRNMGRQIPEEALPLLNEAMYGQNWWDERVNYAAVNALAAAGEKGRKYLAQAASNARCPRFLQSYIREVLGRF